MLMASMLCAKRSSRVGFKRVVCQEPVEDLERPTFVHKAIRESKVSCVCAEGRERASCVPRVQEQTSCEQTAG